MVNDVTEYDVVGIGNAIVDVLGKVGDGFLSERGLSKGDMTLLEAGQAGEIYQGIWVRSIYEHSVRKSDGKPS